jgi:hypothetical protein
VVLPADDVAGSCGADATVGGQDPASESGPPEGAGGLDVPGLGAVEAECLGDRSGRPSSDSSPFLGEERE